MKRSSYGWTALGLIIIVGCLYVGYLLSLPKGEAFFSGDAGIKYLMVKQFAQGRVSPALDLAPPMSGATWGEGRYPFEPPFVFSIGGKRIVAFPLYFPLVCTPFYTLLGWRGLYAVPALGLLLTWLLVVLVSRRFGFRWQTTALILAGLVLSSPLTLYAAMFWEHTLGALFAAVPLLFIGSERRTGTTTGTAFALGGLSGLGAFFRPEILPLLAAVSVSLVVFLPAGRRRRALAFTSGVATAACALLVANQTIYGHPLGMHSIQVLGKGPLSPARFTRHATLAWDLLVNLVRTWPLSLLALFGLPVLLRRGPGGSRPRPGACLSERRCAAISAAALALSLILIPVVLPNHGGKQWGPRYFLVLIPWLTVLSGFVLEAVARRGIWLKRATAVAAGLLLAAGIGFNAIHGSNSLSRDYSSRVLPALRILQRQPQQLVCVPHQWIAQELAALADRKTFLLTREDMDVMQVQSLCERLRVSDYLLVTYSEWGCPSVLRSVTKLGSCGSYDVFLVRTRPEDESA